MENENNKSNIHLEIETLSDFTIIEELKDALNISGILLAEGTWNGVFYPKAEIKKMFDNFRTKLARINYKVEHERTEEFNDIDIGNNYDVEWSDTLGAILYKAKITNPKVIDMIKNGFFKGTSMKLALKKILGKDGSPTAANLVPIDNSVTSSPACDPSRIIISREELNNEGVKENQTFSIINQKQVIVENSKDSIIKPINSIPISINLKETTENLMDELCKASLSKILKRKTITYYEPIEPESVSAPTVGEVEPELSFTPDFTYQSYKGKHVVIREFTSEEDAKSFVENIRGKTLFLSKEPKEVLSENPEVSATGNVDIESGIDATELFKDISELVWEETDQYIRSGHGKGSFDEKSYRTITIDKNKGVKAIIACPTGHFKNGKCDVGMRTKSFLFPKSGFKMNEAKSWFKDHNKKLSKEDIEIKENSEEVKEQPIQTDVKEDQPVTEPKVEKPVEEKKEAPKEVPKEEVKEIPTVVEKPKVEAPKEETKVEPVKEQPKEEPKVEEVKPVESKPVEQPKEVIAPTVQETPKEVVKAPEPEPEPVPVQRPVKEIIDDIVKDKDVLADLLIRTRPRRGE